MLLHFERKNSCLLFNFRKKRVILWTVYYRCMQVKFSFILLILYCYLIFLTACYKWRILLQTFCSGSDGNNACFLFCIVGYVLVVNMFLSSAVLRNSCQIWQVFHNPNSAYSDSVGKELVMSCTCNRKAWCKMHKRQFGLPWLFRNVGL